jgi:predicted component of type VI protein secretion system
MNEVNEADISHDIRRLVAVSSKTKVPVLTDVAKIEAIRPDIAPFAEQVHDLLQDSITKIADGWVAELKAVKANCDALESQVLAAVAKTKDHVEKLHALGAQVAAEAQRGRELCEKLSEGIAQIVGPEIGSEITTKGDFEITQEGRK